MSEFEWAFATESEGEVYFTGPIENFCNESAPSQVEPGLYQLLLDGTLCRLPDEVGSIEQPDQQPCLATE